ncbi:hypothetical protein AN161_25900 [Lysinibacillus sp. FJAT-14222]|nr:hypothetical protein AN161_25900 [Lysinibacillus sp. FJAT-14222]
MFTDNIISKEELVDYRELTDNKIKEHQTKKTQLNEKMNEYENFEVSISKKLKDNLSLEELTPRILHSLVERITCTHEGEIHIHYTFVNPLEVG